MMQKASAETMVLSTTLLGTFTVSLNNSALNLAVAELMHTFDASVLHVSWVMTLFLISMGMTMPLTGFLADRFGRKPVYLLGMWLFLAGSLGGALASGLDGIILARGIQGMASGLMIPLSLSLIFATFPQHRRGRVTGLWGIAAMVAPAIGPSVGGLLLETSHWRSLFLMNVPICMLGLACGYRFLVHDRGDATRQFDALGFLLVTLGMGATLYALGSAGSKEDLLDTSRLALLGLGVALLAAFVQTELRVSHPLLDLRIFGNRTFSMSVLVACIQAVAMFGCLLLIPLWMQQARGYGALVTGLVFLPTALASACCVGYAGRLLDRHPPRWIVTFGLLMTAVSLFGLAMLGPMVPLSGIVVLMVLRGVGMGFAYLPATTVGLNALDDRYTSQASAINNMSRRVASTFGVVALSIFYDVRTSQQAVQGTAVVDASMTASSEAFIALAILTLAAIPMALSLRSPACEVKPSCS